MTAAATFMWRYTRNGRIQVFLAWTARSSGSGGVFAIAGGEGGDPNALFGPRGLGFDLDGNLMVADTGNKRIVRYRPTANMWTRWGQAA